MKLLRCPQEINDIDSILPQFSLFLGGGISNCPDWQTQIVELFKDDDILLINPRRDDFDISNPLMTEEQIKWEYRYLEQVSARMFWFPEETLCPITLFELGKFVCNTKPLFVGCHPNYKRKIDLEIQLKLARPNDCVIHSSLEEITEVIKRCKF